MKYKYKIIAKDPMIENPIVYTPESDRQLYKEEIIKKYMLDSPDIDWYKVYDITDGVKRIL